MRRVLLTLICLTIASCASQSNWRDSSPTHIVRKGETLFSIAWRYNKSVPDLARWNRLGNGSLIYPGQVLRLTGSAARRQPTASVPSTRREPRPLPSIPAEPPPAWAWPTHGRVNVAFGAKPGTGTGVLIDGRQGQAIIAAAGGRVVYAGNGLIGYGKLVVIKHNETFLSAYGYTASLLVNEGDLIKRAQQIATMGEGPEHKARLHFEIRQNGEPVNPLRYLPKR